MKKALIFALVATNAAACSAPPSASVEPAPSAAPTSSSATPIPSPEAGPPPVTEPKSFGSIEVVQAQTVYGDKTISGSTSTAMFPSPVEDANCPIPALGACVQTLCSPKIKGIPRAVSAGNIAITGGQRPILMVPDTELSPTYLPNEADAPFWKGGEPIAFSATGSRVPAFSTTLKAPSVPTFTAPQFPSVGTPLVVARASDLTLAWTGGDVGSVEVILTSAAVPESTRVVCSFDIEPGSASIPKAVLAGMHPGRGRMDTSVVTKQSVRAGEWAVEVKVRGRGLGPGEMLDGQVSFQ